MKSNIINSVSLIFVKVVDEFANSVKNTFNRLAEDDHIENMLIIRFYALGIFFSETLDRSENSNLHLLIVYFSSNFHSLALIRHKISLDYPCTA